MYPNLTSTTTTPVSSKWEELILFPKPDIPRWQRMEVKLDLLLLALKSLTGIRTDALGRVAAQLQLDSVVANKLILIGEVWGEVEKTGGVSVFSSLPEEQQKAHQIDETRSLVLIICHLARQHQALIRRAVALMEPIVSENSEGQTVALLPALLKDYIHNFNEVYQKYCLLTKKMNSQIDLKTETREKLAFKLLIDLLFYSDSGGHRRLWFGLLIDH